MPCPADGHCTSISVFNKVPISQFIEDLLRPLVTGDAELEAAYREMAADADREQEALEWIEAHPDDALE